MKKLNHMNTFTAWFQKDRTEHLIKMLGDQVKIVKENNDDPELSGYGGCMVEIRMNDNIDMLNLYHAGIMFGISQMRNS